MTARMSSEFRILYSLPSSLISVPPYLLTSTRSPFLTSKGTFLPLSSVLPVPSAMMMPSVGFSLALSGMIMPPFLTSFSSAGSTRTRSPRGLRLIAICFVFGLFDLVSVESNPAALATGKGWLGTAWLPQRGIPGDAKPKSSAFLFVHHLGVDDRLFFAALGLAPAFVRCRASRGLAGLGLL